MSVHETREAVAATVAILRHYRAFLASSCRYMHDAAHGATLAHDAGRTTHWLLDVPADDEAIPVGCVGWARERLHELVDVAINRRGLLAAGAPEWSDAETPFAERNHRGGWRRKLLNDYQTRAFRDSRRARERVQRRVRCYGFETPEARRRLAHLVDDRNE